MSTLLVSSRSQPVPCVSDRPCRSSVSVGAGIGRGFSVRAEDREDGEVAIQDSARRDIQGLASLALSMARAIVDEHQLHHAVQTALKRVQPSALAVLVVALRCRQLHYAGRYCCRVGRPMDRELRLQLAEEGADVERLAVLTGYLRRELLQLDVDHVTALPPGEPPPGTRAFGAASVGALLIALGQSAEGLRSVVSAIRDWLRRGDGTRRTVRLEIDGDALELSQASAADQHRLVELFVSRHATGQGAP